MRTLKFKLGEGEVALPVTPMLDMTFQLLFFFIATYNPQSAREGEIEMALPSGADVAGEKAETQNSTKDKDPPAILTIRIRAQTGDKNPGSIRSLTVTGVAGDKDYVIDQNSDDTKSIDKSIDDMLEQLETQLRKAKEGRIQKDNEKDTVKLIADGKTRWQEVMRIINLCNKKDIKFRVSFIPPPPE